MDFGTSSGIAAAHEGTHGGLPSSSSLEMMLVAQLQTRLAVVETELRHAEKERQETQNATQVLLRLLGSSTASPSTVHDTQAEVSVAQSASALQKQFHLVVKECDRLRRKCRRLRLRNKIEETVELSRLKRRLSALSDGKIKTSLDDDTGDSRSTLTTPNDDTIQEEPAIHYHEPHDSVLDEGEFDHDFGRGEMLDDVDTSAPWRIPFSTDVSQERIVDQTQHRHEDVLPVGATADSVRLDDPVNPANDHVKTLEDAQEETQWSLPPATLPTLPTTSAKSKIFRLLPTDPSEDFRMISISNLPNDVKAGDILSAVAGGAVVCLSISRSATVAESCIAYVTFYHHIAAASFVAHYEDRELVIKARAVEVIHLQMPAVPDVLERMRSEFCTRCLTITGCYPTLSILDVKEDLCKLDSRNEENIVDMDFDGGDVMCISFISVAAAISAFDYMTSAGIYAEYHVQWSHDPCARRLDMPQRRDSALVIPTPPQHRSLTSGAYLRRMRANYGTPPVPQHRLPPGAKDYTDLDSIVTRKVVDLMYEERVEEKSAERDVVVNSIMSIDLEAHPAMPKQSGSHSIDDHDPKAQVGFSGFSIVKEDASLEDLELDSDDNVGRATQSNATSPPNSTTDNVSVSASETSASSHLANPFPPGLFAFAEAMASISEPSSSSPPIQDGTPLGESVAKPKAASSGLAASKWASNNDVTRSAAPSPELEPVMRIPSPPSFGFDLGKLMRPTMPKQQALQTTRSSVNANVTPTKAAGADTVKSETEDSDESDDATSSSGSDSKDGVNYGHSRIPHGTPHDRDAVGGRGEVQPQRGQAKEVLANYNRGRKLVSYADL